MRDGTVGVIYHDDRRDKPGDAVWTTDVWFAHSHDRGRTWREIHLAGPSNYRQPPGLSEPEDRRAFSVREYEGMVALPAGFGAAFFQGRGAARQGLSDIFFARVRLAGRPADGNGGAGGGTSGNATTNSNVNRNAQSSDGGLRGRP